MAKIQIAVPDRDREELLQFLQEEEVVHVAEDQVNGATAKATDTGHVLAEVQFALEFLTNIRAELNLQEKKRLKDVFAGRPAASLPELEQTLAGLHLPQLLDQMHNLNERMVATHAAQQESADFIERAKPWQELRITGHDLQNGAMPVRHYLLRISTRNEESLTADLNAIKTAAWQLVGRETVKQLVTLKIEVVALPEAQASVEQLISKWRAARDDLLLNDTQSPAQLLAELRDRQDDLNDQYQELLAEAQELLIKEEPLQFAYDALLHRQEREKTDRLMNRSPYAVVVSGWVPKKWVATLRKRLEQTFSAVAVEEIEFTEEEKPPVMFSNSKLVQPFEAVTNIYGKPAYHELDPSAALSVFFLFSFGLALTDAGYGLVLIVGMFLAERFFRLKKDMRKMVRLLMYAGVFTTILGALAGGWFGVTLEELPEGMLKNFLLSMKIIDPIKQPMALLGVAFAVGIVQLLFAWVVRGYHNWNTGNRSAVWLDDIPWITMVVFLLAWIGSMQGVITPALTQALKWLVIINAGYLVLTQGRSYKNPAVKVGAGAISLYGLISFMSDTLSYSRLLALGLATGIIGLVVNLIASMVSSSIPVVGVVLAAVVLLVGHVFNLGINALGAFIHSGRLQFVEFFPKFMEGGGVAYRPFGRVSKYIDNPKDFL